MRKGAVMIISKKSLMAIKAVGETNVKGRYHPMLQISPSGEVAATDGVFAILISPVELDEAADMASLPVEAVAEKAVYLDKADVTTLITGRFKRSAKHAWTQYIAVTKDGVIVEDTRFGQTEFIVRNSCAFPDVKGLIAKFRARIKKRAKFLFVNKSILKLLGVFKALGVELFDCTYPLGEKKAALFEGEMKGTGQKVSALLMCGKRNVDK